MSGGTTTQKGRFDWLTLLSAVVTFMLTVNLVFQSLFANDSPYEFPPSSQDIRQYWTTVGIMIAIQVGLLVRAALQRRGGLVFISSAALVAAVGFALVFSVPAIDWETDPPEYTVDPDRPVCYSGSGDCLGG